MHKHTQTYSSKANSVLSNLYTVENGAALYKITNKKTLKFCFDLLKLNRALCCLSWHADSGGV